MCGALYVSANIGWSNFVTLPAAELGNFLEGAFAPLAFLWLVIGYFLQQKELEQNTAALQAQAIEIKRTAEEAAVQSDRMAASETLARQQAFMEVARSVQSQLGSIGGFLFISSQAADAEGTVTPEEISELFNRVSTNDHEVFSRRLLQAHISATEEDARTRLFYGTEVRARHTNNFIFTFERLMKRVHDVDPDGMLRDAFGASAHGLIYRIMKEHQTRAPEAWRDHAQTGIRINW